MTDALDCLPVSSSVTTGAATIAGTLQLAQKESTMAKKTKKRLTWSNAHVKTLRKLAGHKKVKAIAWALKRTEAAVRYKAHTESISLAMR